jgi:Ca-activated chloride channel family protein
MKKIVLLVFMACTAMSMSLRAQSYFYINNPATGWGWQTGTITEASLAVHPKGLYLEYGLYLTLSAASTWFEQGDQLEAVMDFQLPEGALVTDTWLWVGQDIVQGRMIDRWSASDIYEGIVNRRRDPSVLFKNSSTQYQLRVYPIKKEETRKVKITYLMPAGWAGSRIEAGIPANVLLTSSQAPDLFLFLWEENGFTLPEFSDPEIVFEQKNDPEFGFFQKTMVPAAKLQLNPVLSMNAPVSNGVYLSIYEDKNTSYYQLALQPGAFIEREGHSRVLVLIDYEAGNTSVSRTEMVTRLKKQLLGSYTADDSFNVIYSRLTTHMAFDSWQPVVAEKLNAALDPVTTESLYSNLPGLFGEALGFLKTDGGEGSILLVTNSDNFGNYEQANALIKDLQAIRDPLPPVYIADLQDQKLQYYYIGSRYYMGQEYLYVNLSKASGGYYNNIRDVPVFSSLLSDVISSGGGMITAFDLYTAPSDGFCYARFGSGTPEGFPVNRTVTQIGKFVGQTPFLVDLTGLYHGKPFSQLVQVTDNQILPADSMLAKTWHGRYIGDLEKVTRNNMIVQEILYESINNRVLSVYSALLCLEPSDSVAVCNTCKDESGLVGISDVVPDSSGFLKLYPNPFRDRLTMEINPDGDAGDLVIRIFNIGGQLVYERTEPASAETTVTVEWDGTGLAGEPVNPGQYVVLVRAGQYICSRKIIKTE